MTTWGYSAEDGPARWHQHFPAARGFQQSPIDLNPASATLDRGLNAAPLKWKFVAEDCKVVVNNGKSVTVQIDGERSSLTGGPLCGEYKVAQFHFHWGKDNARGSEHTVNGRVYPAEVHIVHYNTAYGSFANAVDKPDGLCVLGAFIEAGEEHKGLSELFSVLPQFCSHSGGELNLAEKGKVIDPTSLLPDEHDYLTYRGSLTTPPCFESVQWVNFLKPIQFSEAQLSTLRNLYATTEGDGPKIVDNYRPVCPLLNRHVTANFGVN